MVVELWRGAQRLTGENLKVVLAEFSSLSQAILLWMQLHSIQARLSLELKTRPRFHLVSLSLSMVIAIYIFILLTKVGKCSVRKCCQLVVRFTDELCNFTLLCFDIRNGKSLWNNIFVEIFTFITLRLIISRSRLYQVLPLVSPHPRK